MESFGRITRDPAIMGGEPCIRGTRLTVETVLSLLASGRSEEEIRGEYRHLEADDIRAALAYAASRVPVSLTEKEKAWLREALVDARHDESEDALAFLEKLEAVMGSKKATFSLPEKEVP